MEPIYEFLLWNTCKNNCRFCHQKANKARFPGKFPDDEGKYKSIKLVEQYIKNGNYIDGSDLLMMGGELFDTKLSEKTERAFMQLIDTIFTRLHNRKLFRFYFNSNLIYEDMDLLYKVLDRFYNFEKFCKNGHWKCFIPENRVFFTTSYDIAYRYRTEDDRHLVEDNLKRLSKRYPHITKTANFILTDKGCEFLLSNPKFPREFEDEYGCRLNPIPYIILDPAMAATRKTVQQTLLALNYADPYFLRTYINSMKADKERILLEFDGTKLSNASSKNASCDHNENFRRVYKDDDRCFICDCMNMAKSLGI